MMMNDVCMCGGVCPISGYTGTDSKALGHARVAAQQGDVDALRTLHRYAARWDSRETALDL